MIYHPQVSDGPNGTSLWTRTYSIVKLIVFSYLPGVRGNHFFMGTPAKCLPVRFIVVHTPIFYCLPAT